MKKIIEFNIPEEEEEFEIYNKAPDMAIVLEEIANEVFRPHRKHGYPEDSKIGILISANPDYANEIIAELEEMFYNVKNGRKV